MIATAFSRTACVALLGAFAAASSPAPAVAGSSGDAATNVRIVRLDARFDSLVPPDAVVDRVSEGHAWVEGPLWDRRGFVLFSDIPANAVLQWVPGRGTRVFLEHSGYSGRRPFPGFEPGSNGLAYDREGRLVLCQHGERAVARIEHDGSRTALATHYQGRRLNSPNDLVYTADGSLYFTDPPFGLPQAFDDPARELAHSGVYRLAPDGALELVIANLRAPNGLAFSPDESRLYVSDVDPARPAWWVYEVSGDGRVGRGRVLVDGRELPAALPGGPDGLKVDAGGNLFAAGPGGVYVFAPDGSHLGTIELGTPTANVAWGERDTVLYITAASALYRVGLATPGQAGR